MARSKLILCGAAMVVAIGAATALVSYATSTEEVVARVNGEPITARELQRMLAVDPMLQRYTEQREIRRILAAPGGAKLEIRTVEKFLGIDIDQVAIVDFDGFRNFIDSIGGVEVDLPTDVCSSVSGGAFNLNLDKGEHTLNGFQAITLARTRENSCGSGQATGTDLERAQFQQLIIDGIKGRLTSITRLPYNFIKGPIIGWNAPKAFVSSMGMLTMPQLVLSAALGGGGGTEVLTPTSLSDPLVVAQDECERKVKKLIGGDPDRTPACSPAA